MTFTHAFSFKNDLCIIHVKWTALRTTASPLSIPLPGGCEEKQRAMTRMKEAAREEILEHERRRRERKRSRCTWA
ncbi:hypothetical protein TNCV_3038941 [Trichonephila clavipes]|nr:hypothetical protein TNCV_4884761 [Trichonephila clavipes]GFV84234.1 hypothetical protein TNCV_3038941 [Trichonephila clavipes]